MNEMQWIHGILSDRPVSIHVTKSTQTRFTELQSKLSITGDQVLQLADDLNIEAFKDDMSLSEAFRALEAGYRGIGRGKYGRNGNG